MSLLYAVSAPFYDFTRKPFLRGRREALAACAVRPGESVLEVGCGTGEMLAPLARALGGRGLAAGVDLSTHMLARARRKIACGTFLFRADAQDLPFARVFDCVLYSYSLSMLDDWRASLARALARLKERGRLVVLDFGEMRGWGALRWPVRAWLALHGVRVLRGVERFLEDKGMEVAATTGAGGWWKLVVAKSAGPGG